MTFIKKLLAKPLYRTLLFSIWLPTCIVFAYFFRFAVFTHDGPSVDFDSVELRWETAMMILVTYPSAVPITFLLQLFAKKSKKTAIFVGFFMIPIAVYAALIGGLFGPLGVFLYIQVTSLPAWFLLALLAIIQRYKSRQMN